jgi:hypothetical protein
MPKTPARSTPFDFGAPVGRKQRIGWGHVRLVSPSDDRPAVMVVTQDCRRLEPDIICNFEDYATAFVAEAGIDPACLAVVFHFPDPGDMGPTDGTFFRVWMGRRRARNPHGWRFTDVQFEPIQRARLLHLLDGAELTPVPAEMLPVVPIDAPAASSGQPPW